MRHDAIQIRCDSAQDKSRDVSSESLGLAGRAWGSSGKRVFFRIMPPGGIAEIPLSHTASCGAFSTSDTGTENCVSNGVKTGRTPVHATSNRYSHPYGLSCMRRTLHRGWSLYAHPRTVTTN